MLQKVTATDKVIYGQIRRPKAKAEKNEELEEEESGLDLDSDTDFSRVFDADDVHIIAYNSWEIEKTVYERCYQELKEGLQNVENRTDVETINFSRFCDMLKSLNLSHADLMQIFNVLDYEGRGSFETVPILQSLKKNKRIELNDDLKLVLKRLEDCCWMPGLLDVYIDQKDTFKQHGLSILDFLIRNRFSGSSESCPVIRLFEGASKLREKIVNSKISSIDFPSHEVETDSPSTASLTPQTKPVLKKEDSVRDDLLPVEAKTEELQRNRVHAGEALLLWYTRVVTTTARACLSLSPELLNTALAHTRTMVNQLLPLSLCHDSEERPSFLNADCFHELSSLIQLFPEKAELLVHSLAFHLACGSVSEILLCLTELNVPNMQIDCNNLLSNMDQAKRRLLEKKARVLKVDLLGCDAEGDPHSLLETNWKQSAFSTKPGETKVNFVFECSKWTEISKIKIKVASEKSAPSRGFIFVLAEWHVDANSSLKKELEKFSLYDEWTESDYKSQGLKRLIGGSCVTKEPVAYFSTMDRDEVDVVLDKPAIGKFLLVKFLEPRDPGVDHLGIVGVKFYGIQLTKGFGVLEMKICHSLSTSNPLESNQMAIQSVLRFLLLVLCCQARKKQAVTKVGYHFSRESFVNFDKKTGIISYKPPTDRRVDVVSTVMAKLPFSKLCSYFEIEIVDRGQTGAISVGAATVNLQIGRHPGWDPQSYGFHADDGHLFVDGSAQGGRTPKQCIVGDKMGCGVEFDGSKVKTVYFTKNGERVHDYAPSIVNFPGGLFPTIGMHNVGEKARLVSKEPWRFSNKSLEKVRTLGASGSDFINPNHLDFSNVSVESLWKTFKKFPEKMNQSLFLQLINSTLPHLKPGSNNIKITSEIFDHLCHLSDQKNKNEDDDIVGRSAEDIIRDGLDLFFPSKEARPKLLLDLLQESSESSLTCSKLILFQSLCHYFSIVSIDILMPLPAKPSHLPEDFNSSDLFTIMGKFLTISCKESLGLFQPTPETDGSSATHRSLSVGSETLSGRKKSEHLFHLSKLFNQLQVRLFAWVSQELSKPQEVADDVDRLENLIMHYCCQLIVPKAEHFLARMKMLSDSDLKILLPELDTSFLATTLRELVLLLSELATKLSSRHKTQLLENLKPVMMTIRKLLFKLSDLLPSLGGNQGEAQMEKELRTWEVDSPLTDRPSRVNLTFSCAGATHFEVEFDQRCETETSYETLDFDDSKGDHQIFCGQVGSSSWPMKVRYEGTSVLNFTYAKDTTVASAGYNFKVRAMRTKVSDFHWLYDIYLSFCRLFGRIAASVLDKTPVLPNLGPSEDKLEMQMYESELWTTIFRGGLVAKKFERSLSGNYETADQSDVATFLNAVAEFQSEKAKTFITRCKSHHTRNHDIGGEEIDRVIASVFAALLWHTQSLRHDVNIYLRNEFDGKISDGIHEAYAAAENLRLLLAERRQTMKKELEERRERGEEEEATGKEAAVDIVHLVEEKSKFLLRFAGLSRVALKAEEMKRKFETRRSRQQSIGHHLSHETSVDLSISVESKYPSFRLVFDFVQELAWTRDKVEELLKKRYINSETLWKTYSFMSEFFRTNSSELLENDISCTVFIRELLASQDKFGRHYADGIDGCGLGMEANVRSSYYGLMRLLVAMLRKDMTTSSDKSKPVGYEVLATCVLHLLDIDWQAYDLPFLVELRLPELYFSLAKDYLPPACHEPEEFHVDETEEQYRRNLELLREARTDSYAFVANRTTGPDVWLARNIRARFNHLNLGTSFVCDECRKPLSMDYYRCLDCDDVDICKKCYASESIPQSCGHNGEHSLVLFRYLCKGCTGFIVATRWHCNECNDFNLCNGCHNSNNIPAGSSHNADHDVTKFPTPKVHQSKKVVIKDPMNSYCCLHSWMLFSTTALSTLDFLMSKSSEEKLQRVDENYLYSARQFYSSCLETAVDYLVHELSSSDEVDSDQSIPSTTTEATATQTEVSERNEGSLVSKIIGLIAALIHPNYQSPAVKEFTEVLTSEKFLLTLFDIVSAKKAQDAITRHMALGLLGKLLQQMNISSEASQSLKSSESGEVMIVDPKAVNLVQNLFDFGADCLKRHGLELAKSTSQVLNGLQTNPTWTQLLNHQFSHTVDLLHLSPTLSSIFALFAFTGFPEMLTVGTLVTHLDKDKEVIRSVVRLKKSDETMCTIIELNSRKTKRVKHTLLDVVANNKSSLTENQVSQFIKLLIDTVNQKVKPGLAVDALSLWQLALIIKASLQSVHNNQSKVYLQLYENSFLQCLSHLASLGTGLSKCLLLRDLEILSLELNKRSQLEPDLAAEPEVVAAAAEEDAAGDDNVDEGVNVAVAPPSNEDEDDHESRHQPLGSGVDSLINTEEIAAEEDRQDTVLGDAEQAKKKPLQTTQKKEETDTGVGIGGYISDLLHAEIDIDECIAEINPEKPSLMSVGGDEDKEKQRKRKEKSSSLVEKLRSSKEKGLLTKVNRALAILYARKLLVALVSECPEDKAVEFFAASDSSECKHITSIFFVLPLLAALEADKTIEKVITKVINCCQLDDIVSIATASSFFVAATEGQIVTLQKQLLPPSVLSTSSENADSSSSRNFMDEVYIPGATAISIDLDKSSFTECDVELVFSSSSDLAKDRQCFSGRSSENWNAFTIKGDHLYCTITGPDVALVQSGYHFKVTGIVSFSDHFDVGYLALSAIFDKPETATLLPFGRLWKLLISLVNRSAKTQRTKGIRLLLKLLSLQSKSRGCEELSVDLSLLKGLWQMYHRMMETTKDSTEVQPVLVLALTELFYIAQNVAKEWDAWRSFIASVEGEGFKTEE